MTGDEPWEDEPTPDGSPWFADARFILAALAAGAAIWLAVGYAVEGAVDPTGLIGYLLGFGGVLAVLLWRREREE